MCESHARDTVSSQAQQQARSEAAGVVAAPPKVKPAAGVAARSGEPKVKPCALGLLSAKEKEYHRRALLYLA